MSHKEKMFRHIKGSLWLGFSILCYVLLFCFIDYDWVCVTMLVLSLVGLAMIGVVHLKRPDNDEVTELIKKTIYQNPMSLDDAKNAYHFANLNSFDGEILRIYFNSDNTKRCVVVQESNAVRLVFEEIIFQNDDAKMWSFDFAHWLPVDESNGSLYADAELAVKDNANTLKDYHEEQYTQAKQNTYSAEIWWKIDITSPLIPFASYNKFDLIIGGQKVSDVTLHNTHWYNKNTSIADLNMACEMDKSFRFKVMHDGKIIATGKHYKK